MLVAYFLWVRACAGSCFGKNHPFRESESWTESRNEKGSPCLPDGRPGRLKPPQGLGQWIVGDSIDQPDFECMCGTNSFCSNEQLQRPAFPDQARQALRSAPSGYQA